MIFLRIIEAKQNESKIKTNFKHAYYINLGHTRKPKKIDLSFQLEERKRNKKMFDNQNECFPLPRKCG